MVPDQGKRGYRGRDSNPHGVIPRWSLSPLRLPFRHLGARELPSIILFAASPRNSSIRLYAIAVGAALAPFLIVGSLTAAPSSAAGRLR